MLANISWTLANQGLGVELLERSERAQEALRNAKKRKIKGGNYGFSGPEIQDFNEFLSWAQLQRADVTLQEYERAIATVKSNIINKHPRVSFI
jgi:hypothetical protein